MLVSAIGLGEHARLVKPLEAGELAEAVEAVVAYEDGLGGGAPAVGEHDGDTGAHRALTRTPRRDDRAVADPDTLDVRDPLSGPPWPVPISMPTSLARNGPSSSTRWLASACGYDLACPRAGRTRTGRPQQVLTGDPKLSRRVAALTHARDPLRAQAGAGHGG